VVCPLSVPDNLLMCPATYVLIPEAGSLI